MLHIHFTAFDSFFGFPVNPTSVLVKLLPDYIADRLPPNVSVDSLTVVEVSVPAAREAVDRLQSAAAASAIAAPPAAAAEASPGHSPPSQACRLSSSASSSSSVPSVSSSLPPSPSRSPSVSPSVSPSLSVAVPAARHLWIHLGVHSRAGGMRIERQAVNEMDFRIPDMRGLQPRHQPVVVSASAPVVLQTRVDVGLLSALLQPLHPSACDSWDAGRYLCNCIYYYSLHQCEERRRRGAEAGGEEREEQDALFVHTPPFDQQSETEQLRFLRDLLLTLAALWQQGKAFISSPPRSLAAEGSGEQEMLSH